jgi:hypothetical protein
LAEAIERVVREELAQMGHTVVARSAAPQPALGSPPASGWLGQSTATNAEAPKPAGECSDRLTICRRVLTLADLPEKLDGMRRVIVPLGTVVTPLVLKSHNGSSFIADEMRRFLDGWQVRPLFSPPYTPEYNGAIEAGNGALKTRTAD